MTAADDAYAEAERMIAKAKRTNMLVLFFDMPKTGALLRMPPEITELAELRQLTLNTEIADFSFLRSLPKLTDLSLDTGKIRDLSLLSSLTKLKWLSLNNTRISDLSPVSALIDLNVLFLDGSQITDISPLSGLQRLHRLSIDNTPVTEFTPLTMLPDLNWLSLDNVQVNDLATIAKLKGLNWLSLKGTQIADLSPLVLLSGLTALWLDNNQITDLAPLAQLTGLTTLSLENSTAFDLRPLRELKALVESPEMSGLTFKNTAATRADPRIAEIAEIKDPATRARELFAYLEHWVPPVPADSPAAPSFDVPDDGPITSRADLPIRGDEDQEELRQDLIRKASVLIEAISASNQLAILSGAALHYQKQINKTLPNIRLNLLYSAANSLRVAYEANTQAVDQSRTSDQLPPLAAAALSDLVETHALFFMGFPNAANVHAQMLAGLTGRRDRVAFATAALLVNALEGKANVLDPEDQAAMADDLAGANGEGPSAEIAEKRLIGWLTNMIGAVGRKAYFASRAGVVVALSHDIPAWFLGDRTAIGAFLRAAQGVGAAWFDVLANILMKM